LCLIKKPRERGGHSTRWAAEPEKKIINLIKFKIQNKTTLCFVHNKYSTAISGYKNDTFSAD
jgi:hypothetical protein